MKLRPRRVITRSGARIRGYFASTKNHTLVPWESSLEFDALLKLEFDRRISCFKAHQTQIDVVAAQESFRAFPDLWATPCGDKSFVIEVKSDHDLRDEMVATRLRLVGQHFAKLDIDYEIWSETNVRQEPTISVLRQLFFYRKPGAKKRLLTDIKIRQFLLQPRELAFEEVAFHFGRPTALRLLANDLLACEFAEQLNPQTPVRIH